jgi:crotonobetainyl-CoA:carnitine CoA-transferase CaiB-like acyl-CoA transferase
VSEFCAAIRSAAVLDRAKRPALEKFMSRASLPLVFPTWRDLWASRRRAHRIHPTRKGELWISVHSNHFFAALCEPIGRPELARDPRCASTRSRAAHAAAADHCPPYSC